MNRINFHPCFRILNPPSLYRLMHTVHMPFGERKNMCTPKRCKQTNVLHSPVCKKGLEMGYLTLILGSGLDGCLLIMSYNLTSEKCSPTCNLICSPALWGPLGPSDPPLINAGPFTLPSLHDLALGPISLSSNIYQPLD